MFKRFKVDKLISFVLVFVLVLSNNSLTISAKQDNEDPNVVTLIQEILDNEDYAASAVQVDNDEAEYIWGMINSKLEIIGYYGELNRGGYVEKQDAKIDPVKIVDNEYNYLSVYYYMTIYENSSDELVATMFVYDVNTDSLLKVESNIITTSGDLESFFTYSEFNRPLTRDFNVFGVDFLCATTGLIACTAYCAMIGVLSLPVGVTCSLVCGTAFNLACSV